MNNSSGVFLAVASNKKVGLRDTDLSSLFYGDGSEDSFENPQGRLISWEVVDAEEKLDSFSFTLANDYLNLFDLKSLLKGTEISFQFGYPHKLSEKFTGIIDSRRGFSTITISGKFKSEVSISNRQATQKWTNKKISDVAKELFKAEGLSSKVDDTGLINPVVMRQNETVLQFLKRKAQEVKGDFDVYVEHGTGYFVKKQQSKKPDLLLKYGYEDSFSDYQALVEPTFTDEQESTATEEAVKGMDIINKKPINEKGNNKNSDQTSLGKGTYYFDSAIGGFTHRPAKEGKSEETGRSRPTQKQSKESAKDKAQSKFDKKNSKAFTLSWECYGDPDIKAKSVAEIECDSKMISGNWYIKEVRHSGAGGSYNVKLSMIRNATGKVPGVIDATPKGKTNNKQAGKRKAKEVTYAFDKNSGEFRPNL